MNGVPVSDDDNPSCYIKWAGKEKGRAYALAPSAGTLRPDRSKSVDFDTTKNLYIEGDNLEVLKLLRGAYANRVKMIYIDPPYNTGKDFVYNDDYSDSIESYKKLVGIIADDGTKLTTNDDTSGRYHTNWLNMMFPRLLLAWKLLTKDGVIFISIDDNEVANLKKICDEVFSEHNFIGIFNWMKTETPENLSKKCRQSIEYVLCYQKNKDETKFRGIVKKSQSSNGLLNQSNSVSTLIFPENVVKTSIQNSIIKKGHYGTSSYDVELLKDTEVKDGIFIKPVVLKAKFKWSQSYLEAQISNGTIISIPTKNFSPAYDKAEGYGPEVPTNFINSAVGVDTNENAGDYLAKLFGKTIFSYPKPVSLISYLLGFLDVTEEECIIMDFFSGSGTTAEAILNLNVSDNKKKRHFVMVQLQENLEQNLTMAKTKSEKEVIQNAIAFCVEHGFPHNICSIGEERIRRVAAKIKEENPDYKGDLGFKVFTLDSSNVIPWNPDPSKLDLTMRDMEKNLVAGRSNEDLLFEILLKKNVPLDVDIESFEVETEENGKKTKNTIYVAGGTLFICLDRHIPGEVSSEILRLRDELLSCGELDQTIKIQVVFRETGFCDVDKTNALAILEQGGLDDKQIWTL